MAGIVLLEPEQAGNVGTIGRTCVCTGTALHLIDPLGFHITDRHIRRAGLDYWPRLEVHRYMNYEDFLASADPGALWYVTTKAKRVYSEVPFGPDDYLMFGKESAGIPEEMLVERKDDCIRIPMIGGTRSLNLGNSVAIVLYEVLRQQGFAGFATQGDLHRLRWD